jgi:hypothetical protein
VNDHVKGTRPDFGDRSPADIYNAPDQDAIAKGYAVEIEAHRRAIANAVKAEEEAHAVVMQLNKKLRRLSLRLGKHLVEAQK